MCPEQAPPGPNCTHELGDTVGRTPDTDRRGVAAYRLENFVRDSPPLDGVEVPASGRRFGVVVKESGALDVVVDGVNTPPADSLFQGALAQFPFSVELVAIYRT